MQGFRRRRCEESGVHFHAAGQFNIASQAAGDAFAGILTVAEDGASGLLFPNNDEAALLNCLLAIASGSAFPRHILPGEAVQRAERTFSMEDYIGRILRVFFEVTQPSPLPPQ